MRILIAVASALFLAACQQPAGSGHQQTASSARSAIDTDASEVVFFKEEAREAGEQLAERLVDACLAGAAGLGNFERCVRDRVAGAFDDSGEGAQGCGHHAETGDYLQCLVTGNVVLDLLHRISSDQPVGGNFWSSEESMKQTLARAMIIGGVDACKSSLSTPSLDSCLNDWLSESLELPSDLMERCPTSEANDRNACLGEAMVLHYMRVHIPRLSSVGA